MTNEQLINLFDFIIVPSNHNADTIKHTKQFGGKFIVVDLCDDSSESFKLSGDDREQLALETIKHFELENEYGWPSGVEIQETKMIKLCVICGVLAGIFAPNLAVLAGISVISGVGITLFSLALR